MKNKSGKRKNERHQCIGFVSSHALSFKQKIPIELALSPEGDPLLVEGEVQWIRPLSIRKKYRVGLTFKNILNGSKSRLEQYFQNKF